MWEWGLLQDTAVWISGSAISLPVAVSQGIIEANRKDLFQLCLATFRGVSHVRWGHGPQMTAEELGEPKSEE